METSPQLGSLIAYLQAHRGGLLLIKSQLHWYGGRGWDGVPDRLCLVLDAVAVAASPRIAAGTRTVITYGPRAASAAVHLLIDGSPRWVWVADRDVELLDGDRQ
jgi:hypothetical protein